MSIQVEFEGDQQLRCKLNAKVNTIDKQVFVNRQGVKVVEETNDEIALEIADGTVK